MFRTWSGLRGIITMALVFLMLVQTTGCTQWSAAAAPVTQPSTQAVTGRYRITFKDEKRGTVTVRDARYQHDSIFGRLGGSRGGTEVGYPLSTVALVEVGQPDPVAAVVLSATVIGAVALITAAAASSISSSFGSGDWGGMGGSCPLVYSWDGTAWHLDSGTFGGAITPALARTDLDNLLFPRAENGLLRFRMTDEAEETEHVDAFAVVAIDHPAGTDVAPDARAKNAFHLIGALDAPVAARDFMGRDVLSLIEARDGKAWESQVAGRDPANPAHLRDGLELAFVRTSHDTALQLVVDAQNTTWSNLMMKEMVAAFGSLTARWYDSVTSAAASAPLARVQHGEGFLQASIWDGMTWRSAGEIWEAGPEVAKRQVLPIDARGIRGDTIRIRLESAPSFWHIDQVALGSAIATPVVARELPTISALAPHVDDAAARLARNDGRTLDLEQGDTISIVVRDAGAKPARGMIRSYLLRTTGWYRIHGPDLAMPDMVTLAALNRGVHAPARLAIERMNAALELVTQRRTHADHK